MAGTAPEAAPAAPGAGPQQPVGTQQAAAAAARATAAKQYRENPFNNRRGPLAKAVAPGPYGGGFAVPDTGVVPLFFHGGKKAVEDVQQLVAGIGRQNAAEIMAQQAVADIRAGPARSGQIDPAAYEKWKAKNTGALSVFPEVGALFDTPATAQGMLNRARQQFEASAAGKWLKADPEKAFAQIVGKSNSKQLAADLARRVNSDPAAQAGLRRAALDDLLARSGEGLEKFHQVLEKNRTTYSVVLTPRQMRILDDVDAATATARRTTGAEAPDVTSADRRAILTMKKVGAPPQTMFQALARGSFKLAAMAAGEHLTGGFGGTFLGKVGAEAAENVKESMRAARINDVNDMIARMLADPQYAKLMFETVTPQNVTTLAQRVSRALLRSAPGASQPAQTTAP